MARRPAGLIYWVDEKPPAFELAVLAVQHIFLMSSTLVLPVVLIREIGGSFDQVRAVVALTMIACGLGTIVQAMRWRGIGSGFLCPNLRGPNFFGASVEAAWLGGLPLMRGMLGPSSRFATRSSSSETSFSAKKSTMHNGRVPISDALATA